MTLTEPVAAVVEMLADIGYVAQEQPVRIGSVHFDFAAILTSPRSLDLVVVVDTLQEDASRFAAQISSLGRALDVVSSRRSMSIVLVGPPPSGAVLEAIGRTGRVLLVGLPVGEQASAAIQEALAVLLPLELPRVTDSTEQSWADLERELLEAHPQTWVSSLLGAAEQGPLAVRETLDLLLTEALTEDPA